MGGKLLNGIKSIYVASSAHVTVKGGESEWFRIGSGARQGYIISPWLFNVYMDGVMKEVNGKDGSEIPGGWKRMEIAWPLVYR